MKNLIITSLFLCSIWTACAQTPQNEACKCCSESYRAFDFWVGEWEVFDTSGQLVGRNTLSLQLDSCLLREEWRSEQGTHRGTSNNFYNARTKLWKQVWVDNGGYVLEMTGNRKGDQMILQSEWQDNPQFGKFKHQLTWTKNADGSVRQYWVAIDEKGEAKQVLFDGLYKKATRKK